MEDVIEVRFEDVFDAVVERLKLANVVRLFE